MLFKKLHDKRYPLPGLGKAFLLGLLTLLLVGPLAAQEDSEEIYLLSQTFKVARPETREATYSHDGQYLITLSGNHRLEFWIPHSAKRFKVIPTDTHEALHFIQHPDGNRILTGGRDETIRVWDYNRGLESGVLRGHLTPISGLHLNPTATHLISGAEDGTLIYWDLEAKKLIKQATQAHRGAILAFAFHPDGKMLATGGEDQLIKLWQLPDLRPIKLLEGHLGAITELRFSALGERLISSSADQSLMFWDWNTGVAEQTLQHHTKSVVGFDLHTDTGRLVSAGKEGGIAIWSYPEGKLQFALNSVAGPVSKVHFDSSGKHLIAALEDGQAQTWELGKSSFLAALQGHERPVDALDFSHNAKYLATASSDKTLRIWDVASKQEVRQYETESHRVQVLKFSPDSKLIYSGGADSSIRVWDPQTGAQKERLQAHKGKVNALAFHPDGEEFLTGGSDQQWMLWKVGAREPYRIQKSHQDQVTTVAFAPKGDQFVTGSNDRNVLIWNYPKGEQLGVISGHRKGLTDLAYSPVAPLLATASRDNTIKLWDITEPDKPVERMIFEGHGFIVTRIFFSPDGRALISISRDKTVRLWNVATGQMIRILNGESTALTNGALSPDHQLIAVTNLASTVSLLSYPSQIPELEAPVAEASSEEESAGPAEVSQAGYIGDPISVPDDPSNFEDLTNLVSRMSPEELQVYAVPPIAVRSTRDVELQKEMNQLLASNRVCRDLKRLEEVALELLQHVPDEMAAYHALLKAALLRGDLPMVHLSVYAGLSAKFRPKVYNYATELVVRNSLRYWKYEVFDQTVHRQGTPYVLEIRDCQQQRVTLEVDPALMILRPPTEFLARLTHIPRILDYRDFRDMPLNEFRNRYHQAIARILKDDSPLPVSRRSRPLSQPAPEVPKAQLLLNLERVTFWKNGGNVPFKLRGADGPWRSYTTDQDNRILLELPAGNYSLQIGAAVDRALRLEAGKRLEVSF
ncbi:MAG: WD40 repeat domain-containing protein [bacterium]